MRASELRRKEVVNILDGRRLGSIIDYEFQVPEGRILSIIVPSPVRITHLLQGARNGYVIPWQRICKIGDDVILVELDDAFFSGCE